LVSSIIAAGAKAKVVLIEKHRMGGDCLNTGCVPSKALIRSAKFLSHVARSGEFGIGKASAQVDFAAVMERVQRVVREIEPHDSIERYTGLGVEVIEPAAEEVVQGGIGVARLDRSLHKLAKISGHEGGGVLAAQSLPPVRDSDFPEDVQLAFPGGHNTDFPGEKQVELPCEGALRAQRAFRHRFQQAIAFREPMDDETGVRQAGGSDQDGLGRDHGVGKEMKIRLDTPVALP
jgi:hypothetical protein